MKLSEIIVSRAVANEFDGGVDEFLPELERHGKEVLKISSTLSIVEHGYFYGFLRQGKCIGYIELDDAVEIINKSYSPIKFIFIEPAYRKTYAVGAFLIGIRKVLKHPLILGSDKYGGVLLADGLKLVKSLKTSALGDVKMLNLETGEVRELTDSDLDVGASKWLTLVFEDDDFPIKRKFGNKSIFILENIENTIIN